jgi:hypothetical protein
LSFTRFSQHPLASPAIRAFIRALEAEGRL